MSNLIGQTLLEQFRVEAFVAAGGMGTVYRVWDVQRNAHLALKVLHTDMAEDPSIYRRFEREARALQKLTHPHIVPFYGFFRTLDVAFLVERYVDGPTLKQVIRDRGGEPLPVEETLIYLKAVTSALGYAHANGVVHCDVKPGNVMIDRGGAIFLTDFGVARHAESTTTTLGFAGTVAYMAPEQCRAEPVSAETDVYAAGVMLFEMLTGRRPFIGDEKETEKAGTAAERVRYAHLNLPAPDPRTFNPNLSEPLAQAILKALAKDPKDRYPGTRQFYEALCAAVGIDPGAIPDRMGVSSLPPTAIPPVTIRHTEEGVAGREPINVKPWLIAIGVVVGLIIIGLVLFSGSKGEEVVPPSRIYPTETAVLVIPATEVPVEEPAYPTPTVRVEPPTAKPLPTYTALPTSPPTGSLWRPIPGCPQSRLRVGDWTRVTLFPEICNRLRDEPGGKILVCVDPGGVLRVIGGPVCYDGWLWWNIRAEELETSGWMVEGDGDEFWVDPGSDSPP